MSKFSELLPWLRTLFPPAEARGFQPNEVSEDISLVHQVHQGTDFLDRALSELVVGAAGVDVINSLPVDAGFYHYVVACHLEHNDTTDRNATIAMAGTSEWGLAASGAGAISRNIFLPVSHAFILPTFQNIRGDVVSLAATFVARLNILYFRIPLGLPAPPTP